MNPEDYRRESDRRMDARLANIEDSQAAQSAILERVVRIEERVLVLLENDRKVADKQQELFNRVEHLEISDAKSGTFIKNAERLFWILVAGLVAWFSAKK